MKKVLKIQSINDLITNSSSEVFICSTESNPEITRDEIQEFIDTLMDVLGYGDNDEFYIGANITVAEEDGVISGWAYPYKKGDILIESKDDNSIPWNIMDILGDLQYIPVFEHKITNVERYHLG